MRKRITLLSLLLVCSWISYGQDKDIIPSKLQSDSSLLDFVVQRVDTSDRHHKDIVEDLTRQPLHRFHRFEISITPHISSYLDTPNSINKANTLHPFQTIQGKIPNLLITRPGSNPNEDFRARFRSASTFSFANLEPLIIIDDIPNVDVELLDPNDITKVQLYKYPSDAAQYGMQAASGVIKFFTGEYTPIGTHLQYTTEFSTSKAARTVPVADPTTFTRFGGRNYGEETDWQEEILQRAGSQMHHLKLQGNLPNTDYQFNATYRNVEGILRNTGFERLNFSALLTQRALKDKLRLRASWRTATQDQQLGLPAAFQYAVAHNPTAPVFDENATEYDGYFTETIFDYYNPVALIEQNTRQQEINRSLGSFKVQYDWLDAFSSSIIYGSEQRTINRQEYYDKNDLRIGFFRSGLASQERNERSNQYFRVASEWRKPSSGQLDMTMRAGYDFQEYNFKSFNILTGNFISDVFTFNNLQASLDLPGGSANANSSRSKQRVVGFWTNVNAIYKDFIWKANLRREGASHLGTDSKWGWFGGTSLAAQIDKYIGASEKLDALVLEIGWGKTGNIPLRSGLSQQEIIPWIPYYQNGEYAPAYLISSEANPNLGAEIAKTFSLAAHAALFNRKLRLHFNYFNTQHEQLIRQIQTPSPEGLQQWRNLGTMKSNGFEFQLDYRILKKENFSWQTNLVLARTKTIIETYDEQNEEQIFGFPSTGCCSGVTKVNNGIELGSIYAPIFEGVENGQVLLKDTNNDGSISWEDYELVGNGLPDLTLGWEHQLKWKNFDVSFFFRAALGHQMINSFRLFYENPTITNAYNILQTKYFDPSIQDFFRYSDLFVENASFIRLDYLTFAYQFDLNQSQQLRVYLNAQNLFTITGYTGIAPDVRTDYLAQNAFFRSEPNIFVTGVDLRNTYFLARSFTFGAQLSF
ncbi:MAG: hypothetical protein AAF806_15620 [Bacteroidota bacterium]